MYNKIMIFTDNPFIIKEFKKILDIKFPNKKISFGCSPNNKLMANLWFLIKEIKISENIDKLIDDYELILSCHSKQIFPKKLVEAIKCINIHPWYNPETRWWYPQVFWIIYNKTVWVTIHEMDENIDAGKILYRKKVDINFWDTSLSLYNRILSEEVKLFDENIHNIFSNSYNTFLPDWEWSYFGKKDFNNLCNIDLNEVGTFRDFYNKLRALSHSPFNNGFIIDDKWQKYYLDLKITKDE